MKFTNLLSNLLVLSLFISCAGRNNLESQPASPGNLRQLPENNCEGCEVMFEGIPAHLDNSDTTEGWFEQGQKLIVSGIVFNADQKTPASDVILYYYHTDQHGYYSPGNRTDAGSKKNGRLRGWVKTGPDGRYSIHTNRPAQYPGNTTEAHIHVIIKEPDMDVPYWIDALVFDDDPLLTLSLRKRLENRGGSGIMKIKVKDTIQVGTRDIILGLNIPGYPDRNK